MQAATKSVALKMGGHLKLWTRESPWSDDCHFFECNKSQSVAISEWWKYFNQHGRRWIIYYCCFLSLSLAKFDWRNCLSLAADNFLSVLFLSYLYQEVNRKRPERNKRKRWNVVVYQQGYCPSRRYKSRISIILLIFFKDCIDFFPRTILVISNQRTRRKLKNNKKKSCWFHYYWDRRKFLCLFCVC